MPVILRNFMFCIHPACIIYYSSDLFKILHIAIYTMTAYLVNFRIIVLLPENLAVWYMPARVVRASFVSIKYRALVLCRVLLQIISGQVLLC